MLERASLCLESGGRHLLRGPKPRLRSRRMLHSSFWHHGAVDLDLPAWCASMLQPLPRGDTADHDAARPTRRTAARDALFLDFLYPAKTLALMRRLSSFGWETWQPPHMRAASSTRVRRFSSKPPASRDGHDTSLSSEDASGLSEQGSPSDEAQSSTFDDISPMPLGDVSEFDFERDVEEMEKSQPWLREVDNPADTLRLLLKANESDSRVVWNLWQRIDRGSRSPDLSADVLDYLCSVKPFLVTLAEEVIAIYHALDIQDRRPSSYRGAIKSYLVLGDLGKAAMVHFAGVEAGKASHGNIGTAELLAHAIKQEKWQLAVEVYTAMTSLVGRLNVFWSAARTDLEMHEHVGSFLVCLRRMRRLTGRDPEEQDQIRAFATEFAAQAILQCAPRYSTEIDGLRLYHLIMRLKQTAFMEPRHFELALQGVLGAPDLKKTSWVPKIVHKLYQRYISIAKEDRSMKVSAKVLHAMLNALSKVPYITRSYRATSPSPVLLGQVVADHVRFFGRLKNSTLVLLMNTYARLGDVKRTRAYFKQIPLKERFSEPHIAFLIEAHARSGDTEGAHRQFNKIIERAGHAPGLQMWNLLLNAYARNGDLAGASRVFDDLVQQPSLAPDAYSFTAILDLMSQRGDVDGVKDMFALAADVDEEIIRSAAVAGYLVTAFINNDDMEAAELVAEQLRKRKDSGTMSGSLTPIWNNLATAYALRRDVTSTRRIYEQMQTEGIEPDALTYAALLQVLCLVRDTDAAYKILRLVIPRRPVKQMALHYAIIMAGYINQGDYEKVWHVDGHRRANGIRASLSTRMAVVKAAAMSEYVGRYSNREDPTSELVRTEKVLAATLARNDRLEMSAEPQTGLGIRTMDQADGAYLEFMMLIYGNKYAFEMVERLFQEYVTRHRNDVSLTNPDNAPPLRMLVALMNAHFSAGRYDDVEKLWNLALDESARLAKISTPTAAAHPGNTDPPRNPVAPARAHLLSQTLVIYLRTLHFQGRYADAQRTVSGLIAQGYILDNFSWNLYIQLLARTGRISLAFSLCEEYLMPQWRGWRTSGQYLKRRYWRTRGWDYMNINANQSKPNIVMPQYRTMVILGAAMKYVRRLEAVGGARRSDSDNDDGVPLHEAQLRFNAPRTVAALQAMPHVDDDLQARFLRDD